VVGRPSQENQKGHKKAQVISVVPFLKKEDDAEVA
jgi:hypothetical protein